eukprot:TRINITY_DN66048_c0_g1_i1.p1 TRINITY_DN66048_c0_g1~~TRINITY_DN66048_c0_g1_i1.p1  ORF type:complete len:266 (+),score=51.29 TRINITY_DN66048_c0_g1_i1:71-799(+)
MHPAAQQRPQLQQLLRHGSLPALRRAAASPLPPAGDGEAAPVRPLRQLPRSPPPLEGSPPAAPDAPASPAQSRSGGSDEDEPPPAALLAVAAGRGRGGYSRPLSARRASDSRRLALGIRAAQQRMDQYMRAVAEHMGATRAAPQPGGLPPQAAGPPPEDRGTARQGSPRRPPQPRAADDPSPLSPRAARLLDAAAESSPVLAPAAPPGRRTAPQRRHQSPARDVKAPSQLDARAALTASSAS